MRMTEGSQRGGRSVLSPVMDGTRAQKGASLSLYLPVCPALSGYGSRFESYPPLFAILIVVRGLSSAHEKFERRGKVGGEPCVTIPRT